MSDATDETPKKINHKQQVFIDEYLRCFNGAEAARRAGYSEKTARITASNLLAETNINEQIQARLSEIHMSADEAIKLLSDMARGDIAQIMDVSGMGFSLNMSRAQELGLTRLIKKVKQKTTTHLAKNESDEDREVNELEVELYDAQAAIDKILKIHGKYVERVDLSNSDGTLKPKEDNARFDRAISTLADALREIVPNKGTGKNSEVDSPK